MVATCATANVTATDLQIAARALSFMQKPPVGDVQVGIVYSPANARSAENAESLRVMLGDGLKVGNLTLKPVMVKVSEIASAQVGLFFLVEGLGDEAISVATASQARHIPCATIDISQVKNGRCLMGVRSQPKIEILVNRAAAASSGVQFSSVFRMMITEL